MVKKQAEVSSRSGRGITKSLGRIVVKKQAGVSYRAGSGIRGVKVCEGRNGGLIL